MKSLPVPPGRVQDLAAVIRRGIETQEPHHQGPRGPGPFGGSFDWHSCVHAHWALLSMERLAGLRRDPWLAERLGTDVLTAEMDFLDDDPAFELPYGRVWFLLLLAELRIQGRADAAVHELYTRLENELLDDLDNRAFPENPEQAQPYLGTHNSWIFTHWMVALAAVGCGDSTDRYRALYRQRVRPVLDDLEAHTPLPIDFLDLKIMADLERQLWDGVPAPTRTFTVVPDTSSREYGHTLGRLFQEIWPRAVSDLAAVQAQWVALLSNPDILHTDFQNAGHWVPQFAWMVVYLGGGVGEIKRS